MYFIKLFTHRYEFRRFFLVGWCALELQNRMEFHIEFYLKYICIEMENASEKKSSDDNNTMISTQKKEEDTAFE